MATTPFRMLLTRCRKNRSSGSGPRRPAGRATARTAGLGRRTDSSERLGMGGKAVSSTPAGANSVPATDQLDARKSHWKSIA
jgi:hypothetical protein